MFVACLVLRVSVALPRECTMAVSVLLCGADPHSL